MNYHEETRAFRDLVYELNGIAIKAGKEPVNVRLEWNGRFTARMGDARVTGRHDRSGLVRLSKPLWPHTLPWKRRNTMVHEIAHVFAELELPGSGHGPVWKRYMRLFGIVNPERCYAVNEKTFANVAAVQKKRRRQTRYVFTCPGCQRILRVAKALRTKILKHGQIRLCLTCKTKITPEMIRNAKPAENA